MPLTLSLHKLLWIVVISTNTFSHFVLLSIYKSFATELCLIPEKFTGACENNGKWIGSAGNQSFYRYFYSVDFIIFFFKNKLFIIAVTIYLAALIKLNVNRLGFLLTVCVTSGI